MHHKCDLSDGSCHGTLAMLGAAKLVMRTSDNTEFAAFLSPGEKLMSNSDLLPTLLSKIYENQLALEAAIMELSNWVELRGSSEVADNVRGALTAIDRNEEFIKLALAVLMTPE